MEHDMKDQNEDAAFEQFRQKMLDARPYTKLLKDELMAAGESVPKGEQLTVLFDSMAVTIPPVLAPEVILALASVAIAVKTGVLKPDHIPDIPEELAVVTMRTVAKACLNTLKNDRN
jgi:hypothetical protein